MQNNMLYIYISLSLKPPNDSITKNYEFGVSFLKKLID